MKTGEPYLPLLCGFVSIDRYSGYVEGLPLSKGRHVPWLQQKYEWNR